MKVTIDVSEQDIELIKRWCSVSRTLNKAKWVIENWDEMEEESVVVEELEEIEPMLDRLHHTVREAIWQNEKDSDLSRS